MIHPPGITLLFHLFPTTPVSYLSFKILFRFHNLPNAVPFLLNGMHFSLIWITFCFRLVFMGTLNTVYPVLRLFVHVLSSSVLSEALKSMDKFLVLFTISGLFCTRMYTIHLYIYHISNYTGRIKTGNIGNIIFKRYSFLSHTESNLFSSL